MLQLPPPTAPSLLDLPTIESTFGFFCSVKKYMESEIASSSLYEFVKHGWPQIEGGVEFVDGWHIQAICEHLEAVLSGQIRNLLINVPPRTSKSTIVSVMFPAYAWIKYPWKKFLFASYAQKLATRDSTRCRRLIMSPWYQENWGHVFQLAHDQNEKLRFENDRLGYRIATSVGGVATGEGGDIIVCDDPNNAKDGESEAKRENALEWWSHVWSTRLNDKKTGGRIIVQQRLHEADISGYVMSKDTTKQWVRLILPMEFEPARRSITVPLSFTNGERWQDPRINSGDLLWPNKIGTPELEELKADLGSSYAISGQLQQRPTPQGGGIIKVDWFSWWKKENPPQSLRVIASLDTAYGESEEGAYSAITTWGYFNLENNQDESIPCLILLSLWRGRLEYPYLRELCQRISKDYRDDGGEDGNKQVEVDGRHRVDMMLVEAKANGISLVQDLRRAGIEAHKFDPTKFGDKTQRVVLATPLIQNGLIYVPALPPDFKKLRPSAKELLRQCELFPAGESRDVVDTMTQVILYLQQNGLLNHRKNPKVVNSILRPKHGFYGVTSDDYNTW